MATFVWPPEVQWPPPAHILQNYDVVAPGGASLSPAQLPEATRGANMRSFVALITPLGDGPDGPVDPGWGRPGGGGEHPGNRPPGSWGGEHPGNRPPGSWGGNYPSTGPVPPGGPTDPGYGRPDYGGGHPGNRPPGSWGGEHPGNRPPGSWGGEHPGNRPPGSGEYPTTGPIEPPPGGTPVPPEQIPTPPDPPQEYADQVIVQIYVPGQGWTTTAYETGNQPDQGPATPSPKQR